MATRRLALVVEDDEGLCKIYRKVLADSGVDMLLAGDAQTALDLLAQHVPDVLFLDILLPNLNGTAIVDYIAANEHLHQMRVVIVSSSPEYQQYSRRLPSALFIRKPIMPAQIRELAAG